ncbi:MAG: flagellar biosynthesis protein FlhB [Oscillospiraceae bacterium]|jgi:flagellar biosynthetic protein FlhB|nr:flagellar biosynthesis protein FlhB [Oscillospiraceae bacterium]
MAAEEKTEEATPKRREDERKKGNLFQSTDAVATLSVLVIFLILRAVMPYLYRYSADFMVQHLGYIKTTETLNTHFALDMCRDGWVAILLLSAPVMITSVVIAIVAAGIQTRFKFSHEKIKFKFSNISPIQGFKRLFSLRSVMEVLKSAVKIVLMAYILYVQIKKISSQCASMMGQSVLTGTTVMLDDIMDLVIQMSLVFLAMSVLDYFYQRWEYNRNIKMTKQEVKEEYKELEGNPETKGRIRQMQKKMSRQRMMQQVPTADVVVKNPTHYAVALRYKIDQDNAPVVVAKGRDYLALRIIAVAEQCSIPTKEDRPLARALYAAVEIDQEIPPEFYTALAEIMAWVFRLKKEMKR